jgi:putative SOS response-associated peptidase YedK
MKGLMCGRYTLKATSIDLQRQLGLDEAPHVTARYNLAPLQAAPIITALAPRALTVARWGLLPAWAKSAALANKLINARAETVTEKPAFKALAQAEAHRCLVPCDGFYEWVRDGRARTPHYVFAPGDGVLTMAGLWNTRRSPEGLDATTFTIITTEANPMMRALHSRMPVFIAPGDRARWLHDGDASLLVPWAGELHERQVGPLVNHVEHDDPRCLEPATVVQLSLL